MQTQAGSHELEYGPSHYQNEAIGLSSVYNFDSITSSNFSSITELKYISSWQENGLKKGLEESRKIDIQRGITTIGPHRDDLQLNLNS